MNSRSEIVPETRQRQLQRSRRAARLPLPPRKHPRAIPPAQERSRQPAHSAQRRPPWRVDSSFSKCYSISLSEARFFVRLCALCVSALSFLLTRPFHSFPRSRRRRPLQHRQLPVRLTLQRRCIRAKQLPRPPNSLLALLPRRENQYCQITARTMRGGDCGNGFDLNSATTSALPSNNLSSVRTTIGSDRQSLSDANHKFQSNRGWYGA